MVTGGGLTLGGGHTVKYTDLVSLKCTPETFMILLTNATLMNLLKTIKIKINIYYKQIVHLIFH